MSTLDEKVDLIALKIGIVSDKVISIEEHLTALGHDVSGLGPLSASLEAVREEVLRHTPILNAMDGLGTTLDEIKGFNRDLSANLPALTERVGETNVLVGDMSIATRDCAREVTNLGEKIEELVPKIPTMSEAIELVDACSGKIEEYVRSVRAEVVKYMESAGQLNANISNTADIISSLRSLSENVNGVITGVYTALDRLSAKILDVNNLMLKITESIEFKNRFNATSDAIEDLTTAALNIKSLFKGKGGTL